MAHEGEGRTRGAPRHDRARSLTAAGARSRPPGLTTGPGHDGAFGRRGRETPPPAAVGGLTAQLKPTDWVRSFMYGPMKGAFSLNGPSRSPPRFGSG